MESAGVRYLSRHTLLHFPTPRLQPNLHTLARRTERNLSTQTSARFRPLESSPYNTCRRRAFQQVHQRWQPRHSFSRPVRHNSSKPPSPNPTEHLGSPKAKPSLKDQLKRLTKEYGRGAVIVYLAFSVLDLPFAYAIVRLVGPERVGAVEHAILSSIKDVWHTINPMSDRQAQAQTIPPTEIGAESATIREGVVGSDTAHAVAAAKDGDACRRSQVIVSLIASILTLR